jgi:PAS domain S-box-containing protein
MEKSKIEALEILIESLDDLIFEINESLILTNVWTKDEATLFFPKDEILNTNVKNILPDSIYEKLNEKLKLVKENGDEQYFEYQAFNTQKEVGGPWYRCRIIAQKKLREQNHYTLVISNINSEMSLREQLKTITNYSPSVLYECEMNNNWTMFYISPYIKILSGYEASDFLEDKVRSFASIIHSDDLLTVEKTIEDAIVKNETYSIDYRIVTKNNDIRWVWEKGRLNPTNNRIIGFIFDVTDKMKLEKQLEHERQVNAHQAKLASIGELAAGVAHEINNPMSIIKGYLSVLSMKLSQLDINDSEFQTMISKMDHASDRVVKITKGLRSFARADELLVSVLNVKELVLETIDLVAEIYKKVGIQIEAVFHISGDLLKVNGNAGQLQQVLLNLLMNAKDSLETQADKKIEVIVDIKTSYLHIQVRDNGTGIDPSIINKIFDPFFTSKEVNKGTGIGLSISERIMQEHSGRIEVESKLGEGTTFTLILPKG